MSIGDRQELAISKQGILNRIFSFRMLVCIVLGFASGMPLYVIITLVPAYLRFNNIDIKLIGLLSLVTFPYTFKFLWAPFVDRYNLFKLGRRRSWILLTQALLIFLIANLYFNNVELNINTLSVLLFLTALASATQDVTIDAYRREILDNNELGFGNALFVNAYRVASLIPSSLALVIADFYGFKYAFLVSALSLVIPFIFCLFIKEQKINAPRSLKEATVLPFTDFINKNTIKGAILVLLFVFLYKIGDSMASSLATPFYLDMGYSLSQVGVTVKSVSLSFTIIGAFLGGIIMLKLGINRSLWLFGFMQLITTLGFYLLANFNDPKDPSLSFLAVVIALENLGSGLGTAAFVAYIASLCNKTYSAVQFALLSSLSAIPRTFCNAFSGYIVAYSSWSSFFIFCTLIAIPGMILLLYIAPFKDKANKAEVNQ